MERISDGKIRSRTKLSSAGLIFFYYGEAVIRDHLGLEKDKDMSKTEWIFKRLYNLRERMEIVLSVIMAKV